MGWDLVWCRGRHHWNATLVAMSLGLRVLVGSNGHLPGPAVSASGEAISGLSCLVSALMPVIRLVGHQRRSRQPAVPQRNDLPASRAYQHIARHGIITRWGGRSERSCEFASFGPLRSTGMPIAGRPAA